MGSYPYWYADAEVGADTGRGLWYPALRFSETECASMEILFYSEDKCREFIETHVVGATFKEVR